MISERTKAALTAAKARGVRLGNPKGASALHAGCRQASANSAAARRASADARSAELTTLIEQLREHGTSGAAAIALELNRRGVPAPRGGAWYPQQVRRAVGRGIANKP